MTDEILQATFLDQIQVGDRFKLTSDHRDPWVVTGRRVEVVHDLLFRPGAAPTTLVVLVGVADDGSPRTQMAAGWVPVIRCQPADLVKEPW